MQTKISFNINTTQAAADGTLSQMSTAELAALKFKLFVDVANPPVQGFDVPDANVAAAVTNPDGTKTVTVLFSDIGFVPVPGSTYFVTATETTTEDATDGGQVETSVPADLVQFTFATEVKPGAPLALSVS